METKLLLVTGSRRGVEYNTVVRHLSIAISDLAEQGHKDILVLHGDAEGVDSYAKEFINKTEDSFRSHGINVKQKPYPVKGRDWYVHDDNCKHKKYPNGYCPAAGPRRNQKMVDEGPVLVLAFIHNKSRGATQCAEYAKSKNIPTKIIRS